MRFGQSATTAVLALVGAVAVARGMVAAQAVPATPENAASFVGEWAVDAGEASLSFTLKVVDGKLVGEVVAQTGTHPVTVLSMAGASLVAGYAFDYQGMAINTVLTLTPNTQTKTVDALLDFANGAAQFPGRATKKADK